MIKLTDIRSLSGQPMAHPVGCACCGERREISSPSLAFGKRRGPKTTRPSYELGVKPVLRQGSHSDVILTAKPGQGLQGNPARELLAIHREIAERRARGATRADTQDLFQRREGLFAAHTVQFSPRIENAVLAHVFSPDREQRGGHARFKLGPLSGQLGLKGVGNALFNLVDKASARTEGGLKLPPYPDDSVESGSPLFKPSEPQPLHQHGSIHPNRGFGVPLCLWYLGRPLQDFRRPKQPVPVLLSLAQLKSKLPPGQLSKYMVNNLEPGFGEVTLDEPALARALGEREKGLTLEKLLVPLCSPERFFASKPVNMAFLMPDDTSFHGTHPYAVNLPTSGDSGKTSLKYDPSTRRRLNTDMAQQFGDPDADDPDYHRMIASWQGQKKTLPGAPNSAEES